MSEHMFKQSEYKTVLAKNTTKKCIEGCHHCQYLHGIEGTYVVPYTFKKGKIMSLFVLTSCDENKIWFIGGGIKRKDMSIDISLYENLVNAALREFKEEVCTTLKSGQKCPANNNILSYVNENIWLDQSSVIVKNTNNTYYEKGNKKGGNKIVSIHARKLFFLEIPEKLFYSFNFNFNVTNKEVNGLKLATID